jgi:hypothetical protein
MPTFWPSQNPPQSGTNPEKHRGCAPSNSLRRSVTHRPHPALGHPWPEGFPDVTEASRDPGFPGLNPSQSPLTSRLLMTQSLPATALQSLRPIPTSALVLALGPGGSVSTLLPGASAPAVLSLCLGPVASATTSPSPSPTTDRQASSASTDKPPPPSRNSHCRCPPTTALTPLLLATSEKSNNPPGTGRSTVQSTCARQVRALCPMGLRDLPISHFAPNTCRCATRSPRNSLSVLFL